MSRLVCAAFVSTQGFLWVTQLWYTVYMTIKRDSNVIYPKSLHEMIETLIDAINVACIRIPRIEKAQKVQQNPTVNGHLMM
jgi:hypothetical protein